MDSAELLNNVVNGKPEPPLPYESASAAMDELRTALAEETEVIALMAFLRLLAAMGETRKEGRVCA